MRRDEILETFNRPSVARGEGTQSTLKQSEWYKACQLLGRDATMTAEPMQAHDLRCLPAAHHREKCHGQASQEHDLSLVRRRRRGAARFNRTTSRRPVPTAKGINSQPTNRP